MGRQGAVVCHRRHSHPLDAPPPHTFTASPSAAAFAPKPAAPPCRYKVKPQSGAWSAEKTFYDAGIKNSYPTLIEVAPGDFRAVWDSGTPDKARTHIQFGKFKVKP